MLDHVILTDSNGERSSVFYETALKPLNIRFFLPYKGEGDHPNLWGFGDGKKGVLLAQARKARSNVHSLGVHGRNNGKVDEFYRAAISAGARDNISPQARVEYHPGYYAADVFDPEGIRSRSSIKASDGVTYRSARLSRAQGVAVDWMIFRDWLGS